jgi:hypothetical protein
MNSFNHSRYCSHRQAIENIAWHRVIRIARALRTSGVAVPFGSEGRHVRDWLYELFTIHGSSWLTEVNRFVARMESHQMGKT